jgi:O-acetyl-ADP-ribose deacetylase (regulator of RNase III)
VTVSSSIRTFKLGAATLELFVGDLTRDDSDAIVNPTPRLISGEGLVGLAIHRAAGPELAIACRAAARALPAGSVGPMITPGFSLPARFVIHLVPPSFESASSSAAKLAACYREALAFAQARQLTSIAFPSLATGAAGYPLAVAAPIAIDALVDHLRPLTRAFKARLVLFGASSFDAYAAAAAKRA